MDCHGQTADDSDPDYQRPPGALEQRRRQLHQLDREAAYLALHLIGYTVHRADPNIAYMCLDAPDQDTHHLAPTGDYRCADRTELHALPWCDRLDAAIYDFAATLNLKNEPVWFPLTINHRMLTSPAGALDSPEHWLEPDVWLDVAQILAASPATSVLEHRS